MAPVSDSTPESRLWRVSSAFFAVAVALDVGWLIRQVIRVSALDLPSRRPIAIVVTITIPTLLAATVLLIANTIVVADSFAAAVYLTGLGLLLFIAGFAFALVLFSFLAHVGTDA